ncbi:MAG: tRNA uridine-5-carboxymethylaminomethyl(34) synthesis GTPase MnmE [Bacteroidia bacterium]|nr:tRNA uridine-5-carboxymethylaminomethyl(34) synthesis GTPase MnmE [Bacteroidia bacterium]
MSRHTDTIVALSTPSGTGALGVIRLSGPQAIVIVDRVFSRDLTQAPGHSLHYGRLLRAGETLDEVVVSVFRAPRSYTREDVVEISCHGSPYILREALDVLVETGARLAGPGEFTQRAWLNGALDLAQAEAVADLIAARSAAAHRVALHQMRGGVSSALAQLRQELVDFTALIELELDFGEEDVEFADRSRLLALTDVLEAHLDRLIQSFRLGNALKSGVPTVILGKPNAGKSTLLNALLDENRAIVSDIPGTTRDVIEDRLMIGGVEFRLMDTAGVRDTTDVIEAEGVQRSLDLARRADLVLYLFDATQETPAQAMDYLLSLNLPKETFLIAAGNKADLIPDPAAYVEAHDQDTLGRPRLIYWLLISARQGGNLKGLRELMLDAVEALGETSTAQDTLISHARHRDHLQQAAAALQDVRAGLSSGLSGDLLSIDLRSAIHHIGQITGEISTEEVLGSIFSKFCIGK